MSPSKTIQATINLLMFEHILKASINTSFMQKKFNIDPLYFYFIFSDYFYA